MNIIDRFKNQRVSQIIHYKNRVAIDCRIIKPDRIESCFRVKKSNSLSVTLLKKSGFEKAHYGGTQTCGSVWSDPVCSTIISESRRVHLQRSIDNWRSYCPCNTVSMITYTTPHNIFQTLTDVIDIQDKAIRIMKQQPQKGKYKVWRTIMEEMMSIGSYTGREITFGQNGWHPHRHELPFHVHTDENKLKQWRDELTIAFAFAFQKAGGEIGNFDAFFKRAVTLAQINDDDGYKRISAYITTVEGSTWSLSQEATKGLSKTAKNGNITPFGMLQDIREGKSNSGLYSIKFYEYAKTMQGKKQFFPSPGLNYLLKTHWKTDEEIMKESVPGDIFYVFSQNEFQSILDLDIRGEIVELTKGVSEFEFMDLIDKYLKSFNQKIS